MLHAPELRRLSLSSCLVDVDAKPFHLSQAFFQCPVPEFCFKCPTLNVQWTLLPNSWEDESRIQRAAILPNLRHIGIYCYKESVHQP